MVEPISEGVRADQKADLKVVSLSASRRFAVPGERLTVDARIESRARESLRAVPVRLLAGNRVVATRSFDILASGGEDLRFVWTAPDAAGPVTLALVVDPDGELTEFDRSDNRRAVDVIVAPRPAARAGFSVTGVERAAGPGRPGGLRVRIRNTGEVAGAAPLAVRVDGRLAAVRLTDPLAPGETAVVEIPWPSADRVSRASVEVNPRFRSRERRPRDNELRRDFRPEVNLSVEDVSVNAASVSAGRSRRTASPGVTVTWRLVNRGQRTIDARIRTRITPGVKDPDGWRPVHFTTDGLRAGAAIAFSHEIKEPPGDFEIVLETDVDGAVAESDEADNRVIATYRNPAPNVGRWISIGPSRMTGSSAHGYGWNEATGRLSTLAIHPARPGSLYVGARQSGVWKSVDGGQSWQPASDAATLSVAALAVDPSLPSRIYLATQSSGVYRSSDSGTSWTQISTTDLRAIVHAGSLVIHPDEPSHLFLASGDGVYRSTNGGATWNLSLSGGSASSLVVDPAVPGRLYAAINHDTNEAIAGIYRTSDGGDNWTQLTGCPGSSLPANAGVGLRLALDGERLYASYKRSDGFTVMRTTEIGCSIGGRQEQSWEEAWQPGGDTHKVLWSGMWANPADPGFVYLGGTYFWRSTDSGATFNRTSGLGSPAGSAHVDHHFFLADPTSPNIVYTLNDGGIYRSTDRGASGSWAFLSEGLRNGEFYDHALAATDPDFVIGGTQDNGTEKSDPGSDLWRMIRGGDGATVAIDPTDDRILYSMGQYADSIARSTNGGGSFDNISDGLPGDSRCFNLHYQIHSGDPSTLLASCSFTDAGGARRGGLWQVSPPGATWEVIFQPATGRIVRSAVDANADLYYAGSSNGALYAGPGGAGWRRVFTHPGAGMVNDLDVDPASPNVVYAAFAGGGAGRIYRLRRVSPAPLGLFSDDITSDLPAGLTVKTLAVDRMQPSALFAGTDQGVYRGRSVDGGVTWFWQSYNNGMPRPDVRDLEIHPTTGVLRAATFGRGLYEVNTDFPLGSILAIEGIPTFLRAHDVGSGFGPPSDFLDVEAVVRLDAAPHRSFGFQLRRDADEGARRGMLDLLRDAFNRRQKVRLEYVRTGFRNGRILRVARLP